MVEPLQIVNSSQQNHHEINPSQFLSPPDTAIVSYISENPNPNYNQGPETEEDEKKREREHKKRSKNWTRVETLKLIKLRTDLEPRFSRSGRKTELWDEIAESLHREHFFRDAQQCRDKWEKLMASFKDVREGLKDPSENPYYDDLHPLLSGKCPRREKEPKKEVEFRPPEFSISGRKVYEAEGLEDDDEEFALERMNLKKRKRAGKFVSVTDVSAVKTLLEAVISRQQRFFRELLEIMERKDQIREQMRQDREDRWREEERAHRNVFNNAMIVLAQKVGETEAATQNTTLAVGVDEGLPRQVGPKKRSKNWKRGEVLQLIKLRGEMDARFANSARRAALWDELADSLARQGIKRDGKQCREKWDKLMAAYKDVIDGKREEGDLTYFSELKTIAGGRLDEGKLQAEIMG